MSAVPKIGLATDRKGVPDGAMEPVFRGKARFVYLLGMLCWFGALANFWIWWFDPSHVIGWLPFALITLVMAWISLIPAYFILIFFNAKRMRRSVPLPSGRVAMVVTKVPSEPFEVVRKTLSAMLSQRGLDFDIWLADEDPDDETRRWCGEHGIFVSTRKGVAEYHRAEWPRRTRCKEGNLAYFYDRYGYDRYDFVAQFDADHVPDPDYLQEVIRPFSDPAVGYVSAPSICDANAASSWAARGRLYAEASLHGALQVGYNNGWAPLCIGSHYAVRTKALREIGGLGPELAEDHSTTLMMNAGGWRGVHAIDAIAHGDGPETFADLCVQEFQWSRSLTTLLLQYSAPLVRKLPPRLKFQFIFSQLWYPLFSGFMALMFAMPLVALLTGKVFVNVSYPDFLVHFAPVSLVLIGLAIFWRRSGTYRPHDAKLFGWEGIAFILLRWPWSLAGTLLAVRDRITRSFVDFRITPKGKQEVRLLPVRILTPYAVLAGFSAVAMAFAATDSAARGFYIFVCINAVVYAMAAGLIVTRHAFENGFRAVSRSGGVGLVLASCVLVVGVSGAELGQHGVGSLEALAHGQNVFSVTKTQFTVAGAGFGGKTKTVKFHLRWNGLRAAQPESRHAIEPNA